MGYSYLIFSWNRTQETSIWRVKEIKRKKSMILQRPLWDSQDRHDFISRAESQQSAITAVLRTMHHLRIINRIQATRQHECVSLWRLGDTLEVQKIMQELFLTQCYSVKPSTLFIYGLVSSMSAYNEHYILNSTYMLYGGWITLYWNNNTRLHSESRRFTHQWLINVCLSRFGRIEYDTMWCVTACVHTGIICWRSSRVRVAMPTGVSRSHGTMGGVSSFL